MTGTPNPHLCARLGKVDPLCGKKGMVVSLDLEEYTKFSEIHKTPRIPGEHHSRALPPYLQLSIRPIAGPNHYNWPVSLFPT